MRNILSQGVAIEKEPEGLRENKKKTKVCRSADPVWDFF